MEFKPTTELGKRLYEYWLEHPMTAQDLGIKIGVDYNIILRLVRGQGGALPLSIIKIEKFLRDENKKSS